MLRSEAFSLPSYDMGEWEVRVTNDVLGWIRKLDDRSFDPWRSAILLTGGDKSGDWSGWYRRAIPEAEGLYEEYLREREAEENQ